MKKKSDKKEDKSLFKTVREVNLPRGYKIVTRLKGGYVLAVRKDKIQGLEHNDRT